MLCNYSLVFSLKLDSAATCCVHVMLDPGLPYVMHRVLGKVQALFLWVCRSNSCIAMQLPGANAGKPDVGAAAKDAAKKTPFGYMHMGDLAFDLPGSNVTKDDLPNNVKPSEAKGLPDGPTAKPPNLPKVRLVSILSSIACAAVTHLLQELLLTLYPQPQPLSSASA